MEIFKIGDKEYRFECKVNDKNELFYLCVVELPVNVVAEYRSDGYGGVRNGKWTVKPIGDVDRWVKRKLASKGVKIVPHLSEYGSHALNSCLNAKFKVGDKVKTELDNRLATITKIGKNIGGTQSYHIKYDGTNYGVDVVLAYEIKAANSCLNARFKVGDVVFDRNSHRSGVITRDADKPMIGVKDSFTGKEIFISARDLEVWNSNSNNPVVANSALNAKFKVGDRVTILENSPLSGKKCVIVKDNGDGSFQVKDENGRQIRTSHFKSERGEVYKFNRKTEDYSHLPINSTNPVVANALAWKVRNATDPRMQKAYDRYVRAKSAFDKWWSPNRRLSEDSRQSREFLEAEKEVWQTYRKVYGKPIPSGWGDPSVLKSIIDMAGVR